MVFCTAVLSLLCVGVISFYFSAFTFNERRFERIKNNAALNESFAQYELGMMHILELTVSYDMKLAIFWLMRSSKNGSPDASYMLALIVSNNIALENKELGSVEHYINRASDGGTADCYRVTDLYNSKNHDELWNIYCRVCLDFKKNFWN